MISIKIKLNFFINIRKWNFLFAFVVDQVVATALGSDRPKKFFVDDLSENVNCNRRLCPACLAGQLR